MNTKYSKQDACRFNTKVYKSCVDYLFRSIYFGVSLPYRSAIRAAHQYENYTHLLNRCGLRA